MSYLNILTEEHDLSGSLIDGVGLEILSQKCTNLFSLVLQRCHLNLIVMRRVVLVQDFLAF